MDGWSAYEKLVLSKLETLEGEVAEVKNQMVLVRIDVAKLKVKAGVWGAAAGMIPAVLVILSTFIQGG